MSFAGLADCLLLRKTRLYKAIVQRTRSLFNVQYSMFNVQCPTFNVQCPTFNVQCPTFNVLLLLLAAATTASCQKELVYPEPVLKGSLTARFDWADVPEASPGKMSLMVFADGSQPVEFQFRGKEGGDVDLAEGEYQFIGYNGDTEMAVRGMTWGGFEVYSQETDLNAYSRMFATTRNVPRTKGTEEQLVIYEADELWTGVKESVSVNMATLGQTVTIPMEATTCVYNFVIRNIDNFIYVRDITATLSGMSGSWFPALHSPSDTHCIIPFHMEKDETELVIRGGVRTFGHCPDYEEGIYSEHFLVVYAEMIDGTKYYYSIDVTEQMHEAEHLIGGETEIPIEIGSLPLPKPLVNGSGFQPDVTVWNEVNIPIDL